MPAAAVIPAPTWVQSLARPLIIRSVDHHDAHADWGESRDGMQAQYDNAP